LYIRHLPGKQDASGRMTGFIGLDYRIYWILGHRMILDPARLPRSVDPVNPV